MITGNRKNAPHNFQNWEHCRLCYLRRMRGCGMVEVGYIAKIEIGSLCYVSGCLAA